jgi:hypothetical protein
MMSEEGNGASPRSAFVGSLVSDARVQSRGLVLGVNRIHFIEV